MGVGLPPNNYLEEIESIDTITPPTSPTSGLVVYKICGRYITIVIDQNLILRLLTAVELIGEHLEEIDKGIEALLRSSVDNDLGQSIYNGLSNLIEAIDRHR